jgi:CDP-diacylglycerol--serine O-phosphatidyltransferase
MKLRRGVYILPSLFTTASLFSGFFSIICSFEEKFFWAASAILISAVLDSVDGAVARMTNTTSDFGMELDSLVDLVAFGVAPGVLAYVWALKPFGNWGWPVAFLFVACGAFRLARFNIQTKKLDHRFFVGLPIPMAAGALASLVIFMGDQSAFTLFHRQILSSEATAILMWIYIILLALLMVSKLRYRSLKGVDLTQRRRPFAILIAIALGLLLLALQPKPFIFALFFFYALHGPLRYFLFRKPTPEPSSMENPKSERV